MIDRSASSDTTPVGLPVFDEIDAPTPVVAPARRLRPQRKGTSQSRLARARGFDAFEQTARQQLGRYQLPNRTVRLTVEGLRKWLPVLGLTERQYETLFAMRLEDTVKANSSWPLVSWLGVVLELLRQ